MGRACIQLHVVRAACAAAGIALPPLRDSRQDAAAAAAAGSSGRCSSSRQQWQVQQQQERKSSAALTGDEEAGRVDDARLLQARKVLGLQQVLHLGGSSREEWSAGAKKMQSSRAAAGAPPVGQQQGEMERGC